MWRVKQFELFCFRFICSERPHEPCGVGCTKNTFRSVPADVLTICTRSVSLRLFSKEYYCVVLVKAEAMSVTDGKRDCMKRIWR